MNKVADQLASNGDSGIKLTGPDRRLKTSLSGDTVTSAGSDRVKNDEGVIQKYSQSSAKKTQYI